MSVSLPADDRFAIQDLQARYARALDTADYDVYASLFTPDAVLTMVGRQCHGRDEIREYVKELTGRPGWAGYRHHNTQVIFEEGTDQRCRVSSYSTVLFREADGTDSFRVQGIYRDTCVKANGQWWFAERQWEPWNPATLESYRPAPR